MGRFHWIIYPRTSHIRQIHPRLPDSGHRHRTVRTSAYPRTSSNTSLYTAHRSVFLLVSKTTRLRRLLPILSILSNFLFFYLYPLLFLYTRLFLSLLTTTVGKAPRNKDLIQSALGFSSSSVQTPSKLKVMRRKCADSSVPISFEMDEIIPLPFLGWT